MLFFSTRNKNLSVSATEALLMGIAKDGGLFVPANFDERAFPMDKLTSLSDEDIAATVLTLFFSESLFIGEEDKFSAFKKLVSRAYAEKFDNGDYSPLKKAGDFFVAELYHGPTSAFKDVALQVLPLLTVEAKKSAGVKDKLIFLTATSGDTGGAALEGFSGVDGTAMIVFYPLNGTSKIQERQMVSCEGKNTLVFAVKGNFDDAQSGVKYILENLAVPEGARLSSANSINIGRLAPQISYYFKTYRDLLLRKEIIFGDKVNYVVPTGNFGDILAGYFAKKMGLPIGKLVCASNKNKILTDFLHTGVYDVNRPFYTTNSPSMDILVSSNLERLLYFVCGDEKCAEYMRSLKATGKYSVTKEELKTINESFAAGYADEDKALESIRAAWQDHGYLMDTHTAVAWSVAKDLKKKGDLSGATVILSTASPYKFPASILKALGESVNDEFEAIERLNALTGIEPPRRLKEIKSKKVIHTGVVEKGEMTGAVKTAIEERL
ncbi:MAG: threonine synthase [Clostridia bacterium]|nr:threonine synthase [Clostridia bacterium]